MPKLKTWRRPADPESGLAEITAASAKVDLSSDQDAAYLDAVTSRSRALGQGPWRHHKNIGEVRYSIGRSARVAGYSELFVERRDDKGEYKRVNDGQWADFGNTIYSPYDGQRGFIERFYTLMKVPADAVLIRVVDDDGDPDGYQFLSANEIDSESRDHLARRPMSDGITWVTLPSTRGGNDKLVRHVNAEDVLGRVWHPSYQYVEEPNSPLSSLDTECTALTLMTKSMIAKLRSRFAMSGLMYLPSEIGEARVAGAKEGTTTDVLSYLIKAMTANVKNWDSAEAAVPIFLRGPGASGGFIKHILDEASIADTDIKLRSELIERILFGMDVQQNASRSEDQNHWGSWNASDEERRIAVNPDLELLDWALTRLVLHDKMQKAGMEPAEILRHRIGHDLDRAAIRANAQEDVRQAADRGVANLLAIARRTGLQSDEILEGDEYVRWVGVKTQTPRLMMWGKPEYDEIPWDEINVTKPGPAESKPGDKPKSGPGVGDPGSPNGAKRSTPKGATPA